MANIVNDASESMTDKETYADRQIREADEALLSRTRQDAFLLKEDLKNFLGWLYSRGTEEDLLAEVLLTDKQQEVLQHALGVLESIAEIEQEEPPSLPF